GFIGGDAFYWAPKSWMDAMLGLEYFSRRGWAQRGDFRALPFADTSIKYNYYGVLDRGIPGPDGTVINQGGHQQQLEVQSLWRHGWRFVADVNELTSLTFRLAFADNYGDAINSEIRSSVFLSNNFHGFSFNVASLDDRSFLQLSPPQSVFLRSAPEVHFSSVEQAPGRISPSIFRSTPSPEPCIAKMSSWSPRTSSPAANSLPRSLCLCNSGIGLGSPPPLLSVQPSTAIP